MPDQIAHLCPHLEAEVATQALNTKGMLALPPCAINHGHHVLWREQSWQQEDDVWIVNPAGTLERKVVKATTHPAQLKLGFPSRLATSAPTYPHATEAVKFAEQNWGQRLVTDTWQEVLYLVILNPNGHTAEIVYLALNDRWDSLTKVKPVSQALDAAIVKITCDPIIGAEFRGARTSRVAYACGRCGAGLTSNVCPICYTHYEVRGTFPATLPPKVVAALAALGHAFSVDPQVTWQAEQRGEL